MLDSAPPVSVVISTLNRADSLRRTLIALRYQRYASFEVIAVDGSTNDHSTERVVEEFGGAVRYLSCPDANLSRSRNIGIQAASGEIVAFIDDDAIPEPVWLEQLVGAYSGPAVAGAGGIVYDHTGTRLQYVYSLSDRVGHTDFNRTGPFKAELLPGADPFVYLQGTNMSFRRDRLAEVGGFDEEIEYNFDEVEVCLRMIDRGFRLEPLPRAPVLHKYLPSHVRNADRLMFDPYLAIKNRVYFALQNGRPSRGADEIVHLLHTYVEEVRASARAAKSEGKFTDDQCQFFLDQIDRGFERGLTIGLTGARQSVTIAPSDPGAFQPYAVLAPSGGRLTGCFLSQEYPPDDFGGVGRYTSELAQGFAAEGHEIHVFTRADSTSTLDFEGGVWVHRVHVRDRRLPDLRSSPVAGNLYLLAANYHEICRLEERSPVDFVSAPLWLCEGLCCSLDGRFPAITTLVTSMKTIADLHPSWREDPQPQAMLRLERETIARSECMHAISQAILDQVREDYPQANSATSFVVPLGIADRNAEIGDRAPTGPVADGVTVLFVGRLERRKGVDVLLAAARRLLHEWPNVSFVIAGKDTPNTEQDIGYREEFQRSLAREPALLRRVRFTGPVSEEELWQLYAECDVFCAPSRFESFGLVLVEAMMFAKPVIACATGGMREIVERDVSGLLAEPGDVDSLTECIRSLVADPELRRRLGEGARRRYLEHFELGLISRQAADAYREVVRRRGGRTMARPEAVREAFADVISVVAQLDGSRAERVAARLLDPTAYPVDHRMEIELAWSSPPEEFVRALYSAVLLRDPGDTGAAMWLSGVADPNWRMSVVSGVARSQEAQNLRVPADWVDELERSGGPARDAAELAQAIRSLEGVSDPEFVDGVFRALLGRPAGPEGEASWLGHLAARRARHDLVVAIASSGEARGRGVSARELSASLGESDPEPAMRRSWRLGDAEFVRASYHAVLGREPDAPGFRGHMEHLRAGRSRLELVRDIATSEEARLAGDSLAWLRRLEASPPTGGHRVGLRRATDLARRARQYGRRVRALPRLAGAQASAQAAERDAIGGLLSGQEFDRFRSEQRHADVLALLGELRSQQRRLEFDPLRDVVGELTKRMELISASDSELSAAVNQLAQMVDVLRRKQEAVSLDLRESFAGTEKAPSPPHMIDSERLRQRVAEAGGVRLNLGCGEKILPGYVNVDFRAVPDVDIVADVRALPFSPGEVEEIASSHLVEHFRQHELETVILPYWCSLLRPGGLLRVICPNWQAMLGRTYEGEMTLEELKVVTFGLQDYEGDDHFAMYSPETLSVLLRRAGFDHIDVIEANRRNGLSTEMELVAVKRGGPSDAAAQRDEILDETPALDHSAS